MGFLTNRTVNWLNLHLALMGLIEQSYFIFGPLYLYQQKFSIPQIFILYTILNLVRIPLRLLAAPITRRIGLKKAVMIGATGYGLSYPILSLVHGVDAWLILYILMYGFFNALHWTCFHAFYALAGDHKKRGRQTSVAFAMTAALGAIAPILSALFISHSSFQSFFLLAFIIVAVMLFTLSRCQNISLTIAPWRDGRSQIFNLAARIHSVEAASLYPMQFCWLFIVYLYVGEIVSLGGIVTFGIAVQMLYQLFLGSQIDKGRGATITHLAYGLRSLTILGRALLPLKLPVILGLEALAATANVHHLAVAPTAIYNGSTHSPHPFWYWFYAETAWDLSTLIAFGLVLGLLESGIELRHVILIALPFTLALWCIIRRYFQSN